MAYLKLVNLFLEKIPKVYKGITVSLCIILVFLFDQYNYEISITRSIPLQIILLLLLYSLLSLFIPYRINSIPLYLLMIILALSIIGFIFLKINLFASFGVGLFIILIDRISTQMIAKQKI